MQAIRVCLLMFACVWLCSVSRAQTQRDMDSLIKSFRDVNDEAATISDTGKNIFIFQTERNCSKCFEDACDYITQSRYAGYNVYLVVVMPYNLLSMLPQRALNKKKLLCLTDVLFHFTPGGVFKELYDTPTPQMIIKNGVNMEYYNYSQTLILTRAK